MCKIPCDSFSPLPNGHCAHGGGGGVGLCSKGLMAVCAKFISERLPLHKAPHLSEGDEELAALAEKVASSTRVAVDAQNVYVEGFGKTTRVLSIGFDDGTTFFFDLCSDASIEQLMQALPQATLVGIDLKEALLGLARVLPTEPTALVDLGLVSRILEAGDEHAKHDLESLLQVHLGIDTKHTTDSLRWTGHLTRIHLNAARQRVANLLELADAMQEEVRIRGLGPVVALEFLVLPAAAEMEARGLPVNEALWYQTVGQLQHSASTLQRQLWRAELEEDEVRAGKLRGQLRSVQSSLTGFAQGVSETLSKASEPRVSGHFCQCGTVTGRFTCDGPQLLSIPHSHGLRKSFEAPAGMALVSGDFSCFELRPLAVIANDTVMLDLFHQGGDAHTLIASLLLGKSPQEVTREERKRIKPVSFGTVFGMSPEGLVGYARDQYGVVLCVADAIEYQESFFSCFTGVASWQKKVLAEKAPFSRTRLGRLRKWADNDRDGARLAFPIQGSAADIVKCCIAVLYQPLKVLGAAIVLVVHDEIVVECPAANAETVRALLEEHMPAIAARLFPEVPFVVNVRIRRTLGE